MRQEEVGISEARRWAGRQIGLVWFDDDLPHHPKALLAGDQAILLWIRCACHSANGERPGFVSDSTARFFGRRYHWKHLSNRLVEVGLWEPIEGGYWIADLVTVDGGPTRPAPYTPSLVCESLGLGRASYVYFVEAKHLGRIKIGTSNNPPSRLKEMQIGSPEPLRIVATMPGGHYEERALHARFAHFREHGEWFRAEPELLEYVESVRAQSHA